MTLSAFEADSRLIEDVNIIYPACDVDLFARRDALSVLRRTARLRRSISISTKAAIPRAKVAAIAKLGRRLNEDGHVLKIGISITTKHAVAAIEPKTPSYEARIRSLRQLSDAGVVTSLVLRPLLADVADEEYTEILSDARTSTSMVLIGDEYVDTDPRARRRLSRNPGAQRPVLRSRVVAWTPGQPSWKVRETPERLELLRRRAREYGLLLYQSDLDLMHAALRVARLGRPGYAA